MTKNIQMDGDLDECAECGEMKPCAGFDLRTWDDPAADVGMSAAEIPICSTYCGRSYAGKVRE